jgi:four helix bundle protein
MERLRHHDLAAFRHADDLFFAIHRLIAQRFPRSERYELSSQLRRAALSVPANIVEGFAYPTVRKRLQFLRTAWASLIEADYFVSVAIRLGYLRSNDQERLQGLISATASPLAGLITSLRKAHRVRPARTK